MRIAKLFLPGKFEDAYVYMGRLVVLTENKSIRMYNLDQIVADLEDRYPLAVPIPTLMFSRNDWLSSSQFISLARNREVTQAFFSAFDFCEYFVGNLEELNRPLQFSEHDINISAIVFLDMLIYSGRLYLGADNGFYSINIDWQSSIPEIIDGSTKKKHDAECFSTSARYGTVNASWGDDGLFTFVNDFGWWKPGKESYEIPLASSSLKTTWFDYDIVNYQAYDKPYLFKSNSEKTEDGIEQEGRVLTGVDSGGIDLSYLLNVASNRSSVGLDDVRFAYNSNHKLFIQTKEGKFFSTQITRSKTKEEEIKSGHAKEFNETIGQILTIQPSKVGPIIETENAIFVFLEKRNELYNITNFGALTVRTFPKSKRFQNLVVVTQEDGILLAGLFDDSELEKRERSEHKQAPLF